MSQSLVHYFFPEAELVLINDDDCPSPKSKRNDFKDSPCDAEGDVVETSRGLINNLVDWVSRKNNTKDEKKVS